MATAEKVAYWHWHSKDYPLLSSYLLIPNSPISKSFSWDLLQSKCYSYSLFSFIRTLHYWKLILSFFWSAYSWVVLVFWTKSENIVVSISFGQEKFVLESKFSEASSSNFFQFEQKWADYVILLCTPCLIKE